MKKVSLFFICILSVCLLCSCRGGFAEQQISDYVCSVLSKPEDEITKEDLNTIEGLYLSNASSIDDLDYFKNLTELSVTDTQLSDWKKLYKTKLTNLELWNNTGEIDFAQIDKSELTALTIVGGDIINIESLVEAKKLNSLIIQNVNDADFSFISELKNLNYLEIVNSGIKDISFVSELKNLTGLSLGENLISDLSPLEGLMGLQILDLHHNHITDVSALENIIDIQEINLSQNSVSDITPLANLTGLLNIDISNNEISDISPISELRFLRGANVSHNRIKTLSAFSKLADITDVDASNNVISSVPSSLLKNAYYLDLSANSIKMDNAKLLVWLEQNKNGVGIINLFDNLFSEKDIKALSEIEAVAFLANGLPVSAEGYAEYNRALDLVAKRSADLAERDRAYYIYAELAKNCQRAETEAMESSLGSFNVVVNGRGTSFDCAEALQSAYRRIGISSVVYIGDKFGSADTDMKHYWNIAEIDGKRVYCDLYCDLGFMSRPEFFGVNDADMTYNEHIMLDDYRGAVEDRLE